MTIWIIYTRLNDNIEAAVCCRNARHGFSIGYIQCNVQCRDAMHRVSGPKIMHGYFRIGMHRSPTGNIPWNTQCTVVCRDAMHGVSTPRIHEWK